MSATSSGICDSEGQTAKSSESEQPQVPEALAKELALWRREACSNCQCSSMFYCPYCCAPLGVPEGVQIPKAKLPFLRCDIIFDDAPKKATSIQAKVLAPDHVRLIDLFTGDGNSNRTLSRPSGNVAASSKTNSVGDTPGADVVEGGVVREIPEYDPAKTVVLFPDDNSVLFSEVSASSDMASSAEEITLVLIDSPWRRAQSLRRHPRLAHLRSVRLGSPPPSRFWRYHSEGIGCVSTVEALAAMVREVSPPESTACQTGSQGDLRPSLDPLLADPLLFFFVRQFAYISEIQRSAGRTERPMDASAKQRRSAAQRQSQRNKRLLDDKPTEAQSESSSKAAKML
eukprot:TRINITY_DN6257_c0_g2_i1.p1 TRINITY_DN6257_c0_g2~~TRINITY_DN6257_c0_g2_i1.p1  ORF type:complete len:358 (-),score=44.60 TRINITY_DN6257_c0_g2_i1:27-1055(-)